MFTDAEEPRVPLGEWRGPSPHRAPANQVVCARVAHQRPQLAEEGGHGAGARLRRQRGWRVLHGEVSPGSALGQSAVVLSKPRKVLCLPPALPSSASPRRVRWGPRAPTGRGSAWATHQQTDRAGWDRVWVGVRGSGGLGSSSTLLRTAMSSIFLRKKQPGCAGKVVESEGHGHSEASERPERSGEGREEEKRTPPPPPESWGFAAPLPPAAVSVQRTLRSQSLPLLLRPTAAGSLPAPFRAEQVFHWTQEYRGVCLFHTYP